MKKWCWVVNGSVLLGLVAGCGRSKQTDGGTGGTEVTCPPTLVASGFPAPWIACDSPGDLCADAERQCFCDEPGIEGSAWLCVPVNPGCPSSEPALGSDCDPAATSSTCNYLDTGVRTACRCEGSAWNCAVSPCDYTLPTSGSGCSEAPGTECDFFVPATPANPHDARNVTCTCSTDSTWSCPTP
jgi:hypothetical protein